MSEYIIIECDSCKDRAEALLSSIGDHNGNHLGCSDPFALTHVRVNTNQHLTGNRRFDRDFCMKCAVNMG